MGAKLTLAEKVLRLARECPDDAEIEPAARALWDEMKARHAQRDRLALVAFRKGDNVVMAQQDQPRLPKGTPGRVVNLGQKRLTVDFGVYRRWRIPAGWITKGGDGPKGRPDFTDADARREALAEARAEARMS